MLLIHLCIINYYPLFHLLTLLNFFSEPTHVTATSSTLIDLIFVSSIIFFRVMHNHFSLDHCGLMLAFSITKNQPQDEYGVTRWQTGTEPLKYWIPSSGMIFYQMMSKCTVLVSLETFFYVMEICILTLWPKIKGNSSWITKEVLSAIKKRDILFRAAKSTGNPADLAKYSSKRNEAVKMLRECKQSFLTNNSK